MFPNSANNVELLKAMEKESRLAKMIKGTDTGGNGRWGGKCQEEAVSNILERCTLPV